METKSILTNPATLLSAAIALLGACGDETHSDTASVSRARSAALSAECTDPGLIVESQTLSLWSPNHKLHDVTVADCITAIGGCEGALEGEFIWASSDEPIDANGDGHHAPDIGLGVDTGHACVRSERQGPQDGRVYKLGVRVTDEDGESVERECVVIVDHDQRGVVGADSGEAYRVTFDASQAGLDCEGNPGEPPPAGEGGAGGASAGEGGQGGAAGDAFTGGAGGEGGQGGEAGEGGQGGEGGESGEGGEGGSAAGEGGQGGEGGEEPFDGGPNVVD